MRRRLFADTGDSRWGNLKEPKKQNRLPHIAGGAAMLILGLGPGLYQGVKKTQQEWEDRGGRMMLPSGRVLSEEATLNGKMKVEVLLSSGPITLVCPVRKGIQITCTQE